MKIFIVMGTAGEYANTEQWPVKAFRSKRRAEDIGTKAMRRANEIYEDHFKKYGRRDLPENEYDPDMEMDYTGTSYFLYEVELDENE
ncbi:MAG: hypothetical protein GWN93_26980 [Deltaproteobacteria bacterium]|nr:hypothetical protein [Deltaproteobacteria bacterium]